jgi:hypothetical protein
MASYKGLINFYVYRIGNGDMTIEQVPDKWRDEVQTELDKKAVG